jgi:hypothetical protein
MRQHFSLLLYLHELIVMKTQDGALIAVVSSCCLLPLALPPDILSSAATLV